VSRDIFVQDLPSGISSIAEIPDDFCPGTIGSRSRVLEAIGRLAPTADLSDPSWVVIEKDKTYHIEVNLGSDEDLSSFAFHVAGGVEAERLIADLLTALNMRALDPDSESGLFHGPDAIAP
jgi:hypothetical protein